MKKRRKQKKQTNNNNETTKKTAFVPQEPPVGRHCFHTISCWSL